jgi:DNA-binding transcriptional LysR family regulator
MSRSEATEIDSSTCAPADRGEVFWTDRLVWAIAESERVDRSRPVPMCFFPEPCPYRAAAVAALKSVRAKWRLACVSPSAAAARAAVLLGFGITPLLHSELSPGLRDVGDELGLPNLPTAEFCAWSQEQTRNVAVQQVFEAVRCSARRGLARPPSSERPLEQ